LGVIRVVVESTSTYRKPPFYLLEASCECWLVSAREVKNVPGRPAAPLTPAEGCSARYELYLVAERSLAAASVVRVRASVRTTTSRAMPQRIAAVTIPTLTWRPSRPGNHDRGMNVVDP